MVVRMTMNAEWIEIDGERVVQGLQAARETLDTAQGDVVLDFSSVRRIDPNALRAMEKLAGLADGKTVKVVLRGATTPTPAGNRTRDTARSGVWSTSSPGRAGVRTRLSYRSNANAATLARCCRLS